MKVPGRHQTLRLFAGSAAISLVPVLILGAVLARSYRTEAHRRGVAEGRSEAQLIAQTAVEPLLAGEPLAGRLDGPTRADLHRLTSAGGGRHILRLRLRDLAGRVVYSDDGSGFTGTADDEAVEAAEGEVVAELTRLNADRNDTGRAGVDAVEVYLPLEAGSPRRTVGVLEIYLPYDPIRTDVGSGTHRLFVGLVVGLGALYAVLFGIAWSVSRGLRRQVKRNAFLAAYDPLTELPNRRVFRERIAAALDRATRRGTSIGIAIVDLDRFQEINDSLGHQNGDAVLVEIGRRLAGELDGRGMVARLGGDEFGIIVDDADDLALMLGRMRELITREIDVNGIGVTTEASIGYVVAPGDGDEADMLLQRADVALYVAKKQHAGATRYDAAQDHYDPVNLTLMTDLRRAIGADELVLHYQPKARIADGRFDSVEALVRWQHPALGLLAPDRFLPLAEQTDLIDRLTDWVLARALAEIRDLHSATELGIAINVSARNLSRHDFPDRVLRALDDAGVAPTRLTIEITETALLADPTRAATTLSQLDAVGVNISLDDFGTGHTSLAYLTTLPIDELKIDKSFVSDMLDAGSHAAIVRSIIDLGHNLGLPVVAEGIETDAVLHALEDLGCDSAQGFLLARPMPAGDLPRFLALAATRS